MMRALAFSLPLLGARPARACTCRFGRCWTTRSGRLLGCLPLFQDLLGGQVMVAIPALRSPLLLPQRIGQLSYLLFRRHSYLPDEKIMRDDELLSSFWAASKSLFWLAWRSQPNVFGKLRWRSIGRAAPKHRCGSQRHAKRCEWRSCAPNGTIVVNSYSGGSRWTLT
jgi:hypothetical protein